MNLSWVCHLQCFTLWRRWWCPSRYRRRSTPRSCSRGGCLTGRRDTRGRERNRLARARRASSNTSVPSNLKKSRRAKGCPRVGSSTRHKAASVETHENARLGAKQVSRPVVPVGTEDAVRSPLDLTRRAYRVATTNGNRDGYELQRRRILRGAATAPRPPPWDGLSRGTNALIYVPVRGTANPSQRRIWCRKSPFGGSIDDCQRDSRSLPQRLGNRRRNTAKSQ